MLFVDQNRCSPRFGRAGAGKFKLGDRHRTRTVSVTAFHRKRVLPPVTLVPAR